MQVSPWAVVGFYLWLMEATVVLVVTALGGARHKRPELCLIVAPLLVLCPLLGLLLGARGGPGLALIGGLAATWLPLLSLKGLSRTRSLAWDAAAASRPSWRADERQAPAGKRRRPPAAPPAHHADPYTILGLTPGASPGEVKAAWRRRAAACHPDKVAHLGPEAQQVATATMARLNAAYEALRRSAW